MTFQEILSQAARALKEKGVTKTPLLDARLLMKKACGFGDVDLALSRGKEILPKEKEAFLSLLAQRLAFRPMAYILGHKEFYDLDFLVDERVLIPQPDTETIVDDVLDGTPPNPNLRILDLCCGSGCIGITLARHLGCRLLLADLSREALEVARVNGVRLLFPGQYSLIQSDLFSRIMGSFDMIVSNPPYLTRTWIDEASEEVRHEPDMALDGKGKDGLSLIRRIIAEAPGHLSNRGRIWIECDYRQIATVKALLLASGFMNVYIKKDLAGKDRVVVGATDHVRTAD